MGHPSRKLQCRQAGLCGGMQTPCLLLVSQLPNGWQVMTPDIREERGHPPGPWAAGCSDEDQMCLSWSPELGVPTAWPGKP